MSELQGKPSHRVRDAQKTLVILGGNKSGTSLLAGALADKIPMGGEFRPTGRIGYEPYEPQWLCDLNNEILTAAGGVWHNPPTEDAILAQRDRFDAEIAEHIQREQRHVWGFKQPQCVLTIRLIHPHLTNPIYVAMLRHPEEIAESLWTARWTGNREKALALAHEYQRRLMAFLTDWTGGKL